MINLLSSTMERRRAFALRSAKVWQNYFDTSGLLPDIELSSEQIAIVQQNEDQMLISGSAGSGKSITLLSKLIKIMEQEQQGQRILYCSFNPTLIQDAKKRIEQSARFAMIKDKHTLHMNTFHYMAARLLKNIGIQNVPAISTSQENLKRNEDLLIRRLTVLLKNYIDSDDHKNLPDNQKLYQTHSGSFLMEEILWMKANGYITKEQYLACERTGRGINPRLTKEQRATIFHLYEQYHRMRDEQFFGHLDLEDYALLLLKHMEEIPDSLKYDYVFVDEVQDLQPMQIKALVKLTKKSIVLSGDSKQRIYKRTPFSYKELGLEIDGRKNRKLRINYRSTKQIMNLARSIEFIDEENDREDDQKFVREGPKPEIRYFKEPSTHNRFLVNEIKSILQEKRGATIAIIHRYDDSINGHHQSPIKNALEREFYLITTEQYGKRFDYNQTKKPIFFTDAFSVKGLEFDYVFIIHFDRNHYPSKKRIDELKKRSNGDTLSGSYQKDEDAIRNDEKKILYVALTRAKEKAYLLYTGETERAISRFVCDFYCKDYEAYGFAKTKYSKKSQGR